MKAIWRRPFVIPIVLAVSAVVGRLVWVHEYPWARYGVSYKLDYGESDTLQFLQFYINRQGRQIEGPFLMASNLYITYQSRPDSPIPDAVVRTQGENSCFVTLRLNLSDPTKPEFEIPAGTCISVYYPPLGYTSGF